MKGILILAGALVALSVLGRFTKVIVALLFGRQVGQAALERQPDQIHLEPAGDKPWKNGIPEGIATQMSRLGFQDAGTYRIRELPVVVQLLAHPGDGFYACIYEHAKAGCWFDYVCRYQGGGSATFTTSAPTGLDPRPNCVMVHAPGATPNGLYARARSERPNQMLDPVSAKTVAREFEQAYADHIAWIKGRGISTHEVVKVATKKAA